MVRAGAIAFFVSGILLLSNEISIFLLTFNLVNTEAYIRFGISSSITIKLIFSLITPVQLPTSFEAAMLFIASNSISFQIVYGLDAVVPLVLLISVPALYFEDSAQL